MTSQTMSPGRSVCDVEIEPGMGVGVEADRGGVDQQVGSLQESGYLPSQGQTRIGPRFGRGSVARGPGLGRGERLTIVIEAAWAKASSTAIARAAPPAPRITACSPLIPWTLASDWRKPLPSVLSPIELAVVIDHAVDRADEFRGGVQPIEVGDDGDLVGNGAVESAPVHGSGSSRRPPPGLRASPRRSGNASRGPSRRRPARSWPGWDSRRPEIRRRRRVLA